MEEAGTHVLKLNIGNPAPFGFRTPDEVFTICVSSLPNAKATLMPKDFFRKKAIMQYAQLSIFPMFLLEISIRATASAS